MHKYSRVFNATQTTRNINKVCEEESVDQCTVKRWFPKFRRSVTSLEVNKDRGRHAFIENEKMKTLLSAINY